MNCVQAPIKKASTYKGELPYQSEFSHRYACWARNHRGWAKMKKFNKEQRRRQAVVNAYIDRQARKTGACLHCPWHTTGAACVLPRCFKPRKETEK